MQFITQQIINRNEVAVVYGFPVGLKATGRHRMAAGHSWTAIRSSNVTCVATCKSTTVIKMCQSQAWTHL